jgi:hypothetical protein
MLNACLCTIYFVFCYTLWHFYAFFGTNLLTRCHSASSLFSVVFVFQKRYTGNILGIGRNEARTFYFSWTRDEDRRRAGGGPGTHHTRGWHAPPPGRTRGWCGAPGHPLMLPLHLFKAFRLLNPKSVGVSPSKVPQRRRHRRPILGNKSLYSGTLPGWGSAPGAISIDSIASTAVSIDSTPSPSTMLSPMMRRE